MKGIRNECQLMERCDGHGGGVRGGEVWLRCEEVWEGVTVVRKCDSLKEVCQFVGRCDGHGEKQMGLRRCITWQEV